MGENESTVFVSEFVWLQKKRVAAPCKEEEELVQKMSRAIWVKRVATRRTYVRTYVRWN